MKYDDTSSEQTVPAFQDSIDGGSYSTGICGEKLVALAAGAPSFLTITADVSDPLTLPLKITYDPALATDADIKTHTVSYTVTSKEYSS